MHNVSWLRWINYFGLISHLIHLFCIKYAKYLQVHYPLGFMHFGSLLLEESTKLNFSHAKSHETYAFTSLPRSLNPAGPVNLFLHFARSSTAIWNGVWSLFCIVLSLHCFLRILAPFSSLQNVFLWCQNKDIPVPLSCFNTAWCPSKGPTVTRLLLQTFSFKM